MVPTGNGLEAILDEQGAQSFDVLLMDVQMPELDGFEATGRIREKEKTTGGHIPIIALTPRTYDAIGRYGGDEFLVALPGCNSEHATGLAQRLLAGIGSRAVDTAEGMIKVSLSLGIAISGKETGTEANALVRAADRALYRAKEKGRNRMEAAVEGDVRQESPRQ